MATQSHKSHHRPFRFERRHEKLAPLSVFAKRIAGSLLIALAMIALALSIGLAGYHWLGGF
ncbi:MAG TPA: hypothetical protein VE863_17505, partial [Pyrinomonadaceae bacterium]|nr:hypothetical protein [Pyrinomonadaceae bacterium]